MRFEKLRAEAKNCTKARLKEFTGKSPTKSWRRLRHWSRTRID